MQNQFIYPLRIHVEDTDFVGVVYHSNYLKFMERARSEWMEELGLGMHWQREHHVYFPIHSLNMSFSKPARVHEKVEVVSSIQSIGRASVVYAQHLRFPGAADKIICKAEIKIACVDEQLRPRALPASPILTTIRRELT